MEEISSPGRCSRKEDSFMNFKIGDVIRQYKILSFIGKGSFGRVASARDLQKCRIVALKIIKNTAICRRSFENEVQFMTKLGAVNRRSRYLWVQMLDYFQFDDHLIIVYERLGDDLYTFLKENGYQPYEMSHIRHIAYQLIYSVKALHDHFIIHTDLKPENICFLSSEYTCGDHSFQDDSYRTVLNSEIRLIDFGLAMSSRNNHRGIIQTKHYRCPEVVFGMEWSSTCDNWSIGCILFELYTGSCLFYTRPDYVGRLHSSSKIRNRLPAFKRLYVKYFKRTLPII